MRIAFVQTRLPARSPPTSQHTSAGSSASPARGADMILFPELSLLAYEPKHAARFALRADSGPRPGAAQLS